MTISERLFETAAASPYKPAVIILGEANAELDRLSYRDLLARATATAAQLSRSLQPGARVILSYPNSVEFVVAFFGCLLAGMVPVPVPQVHGRRFHNTVLTIAIDSGASAVFYPDPTDPALAALASQDMALLTVSDLTADFSSISAPQPADFAYLQYTSGSTSQPKGVCVSHGNLGANLAMMTEVFQADHTSDVVGWAPLFHDMGLVANLLHPLYLGATSILMQPGLFAAKPWLWLQAISQYRADISGGPNFAYDLCLARARHVIGTGVDLSCWRLAFNSAEPVRHATIDRFAQVFGTAGFRARAIYPCYGMAEATLLVSGGRPATAPKVQPISRAALARARIAPPAGDVDRLNLVGCGRALAQETICIVDPHTGRQMTDGTIGEIWIAGPHVPRGYWPLAAGSGAGFDAVLDEHPGKRFFRTGDLGFLAAGELFVTGRLKDMLILRGKNIYPQDIEYRAERSCTGLRINANAAFALEPTDSQPQKIVLVQEVEREARASIDPVQTVGAIRQSVFEELAITLDHVLLVKPGQVPKTSSGKVRRSSAREIFARRGFQEVTGRPRQAVVARSADHT